MGKARTKKCLKLFALEWDYSKLSFFHHDWREFAYTPWLPFTRYFQMIYLIYRWLVACYFFGWLIASGISSGSVNYFTYLTNLSFIILNCYFTIAAIAVTFKYVVVYFVSKITEDEGDYDPCRATQPVGCCGYKDNKIQWYQMIQWLFYLLGTEMAVGVSILYWALLYRGGPVSSVSINTHLVNGIFGLMERWICGIPTNTLHVLYLMSFGAGYIVFTGIYFAASGNVLYSVLDYEKDVSMAVGVCFGVVLVFIPFVHFIIFYSQSKLQAFVICLIYKKCKKKSEEPNSFEQDTSDNIEAQ